MKTRKMTINGICIAFVAKRILQVMKISTQSYVIRTAFQRTLPETIKIRLVATWMQTVVGLILKLRNCIQPDPGPGY